MILIEGKSGTRTTSIMVHHSHLVQSIEFFAELPLASYSEKYEPPPLQAKKPRGLFVCFVCLFNETPFYPRSSSQQKWRNASGVPTSLDWALVWACEGHGARKRMACGASAE